MRTDETDLAYPHDAEASASEFDRRGFLVWAAAASFGATSFFMLATLVQAFQPPSRSITGMTEVGEVTVARISDLEVGEPVLADYGDDRIFVVKVSDTQARAYDAACPHARCTLGFDAASNRFRCPCHQSVFTAEGHRVSGPTPRGMVEAVTEVVNGNVVVSGFRV